MAYTPLVTDAEVFEIIETDLTDIDAFLQSAAAITSEVLSSTSLSSDLKKEIERWLAAHFISMRDQRVESEKTGDASFNYEGVTGMGLKYTRYGQQAMALDISGSLDDLSKQTMQFEVL